MSINMIREQKKYLNNSKLEIAKKMLSDPINYLYLTTEILSSLQNFEVSNDNMTLYFCNKVINVASIAGLVFNYVKADKKSSEEFINGYEKYLTDLIKQTNTYNNLQEDYNKITNDLSILFKETNINNIIHLCKLFNIMLNQGKLSYNGEQKFTSYKNDYSFVEELLGARVFSGYSVCRHIGSLLSDVLEKLDYDSVPLKTIIINSQKTHDNLKMNHLVVGITKDNQRIIYDPTNDIWGTYYPSEEIGNMSLFNAIGVKNELFVIPQNQELLSGGMNRYINFARFLSTTKTIDEQTLFDNIYNQELREIFENNQKLINDFYDNEKSLMDKIVHEEEMICPHSDGPILKWTID